MFPGARTVGATFGVVLVSLEGVELQIATFRSDHAYSDHRRPSSVTYETDPRLDVLRRDFTINGLLEDPLTGEILDFVNGRADLDARLVRAIGDPAARFAEDALRMLRAVRFAARLGFAIHPATLDAIRAAAPTIGAISAERVRDELSLILTESGPSQGFVLLDQSALLPLILPEISAMQGIAQPPEFHPEGDVWTHTLLCLQHLENPSLELALAALLHDVAKPATFNDFSGRIRFDGHAALGAAMASNILSRLRYPNAVIESVASLIANHMRFMETERMGPAAFKRLLRLPRFDDQLELLRIDSLAALRPLTTYDLVRRRISEIPPEQIRPPRLLTGDDLIALGYAPGPLIGEILHALEEAQLDGRITSPAEARRFAMSLYRPDSGTEGPFSAL
jgi:poly(A) polymerase